MSLGVEIFKLNVMLFGKLLCRLGIRHLCGIVKINSGILLYGFGHGHSFERLSEVKFDIAVLKCGRTEYFLSHMTEHVLG